MGVCNSKQATDTRSTHGGSPTPPDQPSADDKAAAATTTPAAAPTAAAAAAGTGASTDGDADGMDKASSQDYPSTPHRPIDPIDDGSTPQVHTYNSTEKPSRSALRPSIDGRSPGQYSRKSSSGLSSVGFSVTMNAPEAEASNSSHPGGDSISLKKIVDMFYDKVLIHPTLGPFFENIDMQKLKNHQVRFMGLAFGGKELVFEEDPNLNLRKVHYHLIRDKGLTLEHWQQFVGLFEKTLNQLEREIPEETREAAMRSIHATQHYFVPIGQETMYTNSSIAALPIGEAEPAAAAGEQQPQVQA